MATEVAGGHRGCQGGTLYLEPPKNQGSVGPDLAAEGGRAGQSLSG